MSKVKLTQEEISKGFEQSLKDGTLTDLMGNVLTEKDLITFEVEGDNPLTSEQVITILRGLQGKILTIIDATFEDEKRLKYVKDLVRESFNHTADWVFTLGVDKVEKK